MRHIRYADYWTEGRSPSATTWIEPEEARRRYETSDEAFTAAIWSEESGGKGRPSFALNVGKSRRVRVVFLDEQGGRVRDIDYDWRDGRLWRWITMTYVYPGKDRRYTVDQAIETTEAKFEPNGDGRVEIHDKVASPREKDVLTVEDSPVQGFWLDRPEFGEWDDLLNPLYGVP